MRTVLGVPLIAVLLTVFTVNTADACYCGAARYLRCKPNCCVDYASCKQQCYTVMKTCKQVVYEKQQYTCYKTCYERVCVPKTINCVKYVPETCYRDVTYTVCKPV